MEYDNTNRGVLFKNDKDGNEKRPDFKGNIDVKGVEYELSAWIKTSKNGNKFMSLSVKDRYNRQEHAAEIAPIKQNKNLQEEDEIPF